LAQVDDGPLHRLVSADQPTLAFAVVEPGAICADLGELVLDEQSAGILEVTSSDDVTVFVVLTVTAERVTANLLGPIVVNPARGLACQVVAPGHPVRALVADRGLLCLS